jgi:hypothetical protein
MGGHVVKKSKFTEEQIAFALKQAELGTSNYHIASDGERERAKPSKPAAQAAGCRRSHGELHELAALHG